jgi:hypothetical protein
VINTAVETNINNNVEKRMKTRLFVPLEIFISYYNNDRNSATGATSFLHNIEHPGRGGQDLPFMARGETF